LDETLNLRRAAELAEGDHQNSPVQSALVNVLDQRRQCLIVDRSRSFICSKMFHATAWSSQLALPLG